MKITVENQPKKLAGHTTLVIFTTKTNKGKKSTIAVAGTSCPNDLEGELQKAHSEGLYTSNNGSSLYLRNQGAKEYDHTLFFGLGDEKSINYETLRSAGGHLVKQLRASQILKVDIDLASATALLKDIELATQALTEGLQLADYSFDDHKTLSTPDKPIAARLMCTDAKLSKAAKAGNKTGTLLAEAVNFSKWLGDSPGNTMSPDLLAKAVVKEAKGTGIKVTVWNKARIEKEKFGGLLGVAQGSAQEPRFIIMEYNGAGPKKKPIAFVGKGLTFDCGGISIKPSSKMEEMKYDMCGGANVIGAVLAIAKLKLKVNVIGYIPSTENLAGPAAIKPGDVVTFRNGKTCNVDNTDAEGRLILADALAYASEKKPAAIIDAATLTGAMVVALGNSYTGVFGRTDQIPQLLLEASKHTDEKVWQMPLCEHHLDDMKGTYSDLRNISSFSGAGSSTAAAFLSHFVDESIPWAHCDIAGTAWNASNRLSYVPKVGATGAMIRTFVKAAEIFK